jgi:hypothetical protein
LTFWITSGAFLATGMTATFFSIGFFSTSGYLIWLLLSEISLFEDSPTDFLAL